MLHKNSPAKGYITLSWSPAGDEDGDDAVAMVVPEYLFDRLARMHVGFV